MPEQKELSHFESGCASAPPGICYSSQLDSASKDYTHNTADSTNSSGQPSFYSHNINSFIHQKTHSSTDSDCSFYSNSNDYSSPTSRTNVTDLEFQSSNYSEDYLPTSHTHSSFSSSNNFTSFINANNSSINSNTKSNNSSNNSSIEFTSISKIPFKSKEDFCTDSNTSIYQSTELSLLNSFNCSKIPKPVSATPLKQIGTCSNVSFPSNTQLKHCQDKESIHSLLDKNSKLKKNLEGTQKSVKLYKDDSFDSIQQLFSKNGTKFKNSEEASQNLVTDSLLQLLQKKNSQDNFSYELGDRNSFLVSLSNKYIAEEVSGLKKKESNEDIKLMNDFLTKILSEKEEKRFKSFDDKKKVLQKDSFDDLSNELDERKIKRDAMSHYQEDKSHQKTRSTNYGDYNQWEYFSQQNIQTPNNHSRRGHFPFGGSSQQHPVGWNPMGIGMPRQSNPYYSNPHGHVMPAHAHSDYRYNQWNNPNHKNIPNIHNAHSQNTILPQSKADIKHHSDISNSDFGLPIGSTSEFSKYRAASRDLMHRSASNLTEKSTRPGIHPEHLTSVPPALRNSSALRTPPISNHPKAVINPLSDLQMLVTNQDGEKIPQKNDNFQQESVDLSAHSEIAKQKENLEDKSVNGSKNVKEFRSPVSVIHVQNKPVISVSKESEKPVELTSKCTDKSAETKVPPSLGRNNSEKKSANSGNAIDNEKESTQNEILKDYEKPLKTSVIVEKEASSGDTKNTGDIPATLQNKECEKEEKENPTAVEKKEKGSVENHKTGESSLKSEDPEVVNENVATQNGEEPKGENSSESAAHSEEKSSENVETSKTCKRKAEDEETATEKKKVFLEVESQLEKMFEGAEKENSNLPTVISTSPEVKTPVNEISKKTPKKKPLRKSRIGRLSSGQSSGSERSLPCKKSKSLGSKEESRKKVKKTLCDVMDRRGPFLHLEGSRESPASVIVVNFPKGDDEDEKEKNLAKKQILNASRTKHHNELDYRGRSRNGLYSSTLSARYDAHTTDHTWVCVFCKKGPHYNTMGDLFGPYIISKDENTSLGDFSGDEKDISDAQKRGGRNKKSLRSNNMVEHFQKMSRKLRRTQSTESCLIGMTLIPDDHAEVLRYEVWVHEQCAVWSPNVFLIGSRIIGMQEAIWCSVKTVCSKCGISGANIGCVYRNCPNRSHYHCAKESGWSLEQENFISTCHIHKPRS